VNIGPSRSKPKTLLVGFVLILGLALSASTRLSYTGPNRPSGPTCFPGQTSVAVLTQRKNRSNNSCNIWVAFEYSCADPAWKQYALWPYHAGTACEDGRDFWIDEATVIPNVVAPPATVTVGLDCTQPGLNGWCRAGNLQLSGAEPLAGERILALEGTRNGDNFACPGTTCRVPLVEGPNDFQFWALSSYGDTSLMGTASQAVDASPPSLSTSLSGTRGLGNWYQTASLNASAADALSRLASTEISLDGGPWIPFSGTAAIPEGQHTLQARATDFAGNQTLSQPVTAWVDRTPPQITPRLAGTSGQNGWYISSVEAAASASDATSGLATFEYALDGGAWTAFSTPLSLTDGTHRLSFYAEDAAGQSSQVDLVLPIDTQAPQIGGQLQGTPGQNGWYLSPVTLTASAADPSPGFRQAQPDSSGLASFTYALDSAAPVPYTAPLTLADGQHSLTLTAADAAGLTASTTQTVKVDTQPPSLELTSRLPEWLQQTVTFNGVAADSIRGLAQVEISTDNGASWQAVSGLTGWSYPWATQSSADGAQTLRLRAVDLAGWTTEKAFNVQIDNTGPTISAPNAWNIRNQAKIRIADEHSGLAEARIEIFDPQNRAPRRKIEFESGDFPLIFAWDRQMGDGSEAAAGDYTVLITAVDQLGNVSQKTATISNPWLASFLPQLPPALVEAEETPTPSATPAPTLEPTPTAPLSPVAATTSFGAPESLWRVPEPQAQPAQLPARTKPPLETFFDQVENLVSPAPLAAATPAEQDLGSNLLWGGAATAAVGALAVIIEQRRREREAEAAALAAAFAAARAAGNSSDSDEGESDVKAKRKAKARAKADPGYAQAAALQTAIATQTAKEHAAWEASVTARIEQEAGYQATSGVERQQYLKERLGETWQNEQAAIQDDFANKMEAALEQAKADGLSDQQIKDLAYTWKMGGAAVGQAAVDDKVAAVRVENAQAQAAAQNLAAWEQAQAIEKAQEALAAQADDRQRQELSAFLQGERATAPTVPENSWLASLPFVGSQLATAWQDLQQAWDENVDQPYLQPALSWAEQNVFAPAQQLWNQYVYEPLLKPVWAFVTQTVPQAVKDLTQSFFPQPKVAKVAAPAQNKNLAQVGMGLALTATALGAGALAWPQIQNWLCGTPTPSSFTPPALLMVLPATAFLSNKGKRWPSVLLGLMVVAILLSACGATPTSGSPTALPTPCPTATSEPTQTLPLPTEVPEALGQLSSAFLPSDNYALPFLVRWINQYGLLNPEAVQKYDYDTWLRNNGFDPASFTDQEKALLFWQNRYNEEILKQAQIYGIDPNILKGQMLVESNGAVDPGGSYVGLMQIGSGEIANVLGDAPEEMLAKILALYNKNGGPCPQAGYGGCDHASQALPPFYDGQGKPLYNSYSEYYKWLSANQKYSSQYADFNALALRVVDGQCLPSDTTILGCTAGKPMIDEGTTSIQFAAAIDAYNRKKFVEQGYISQENWDQLSRVDQDKLVIAAYNSGLDGIGDVIYQIIIQNGKLESWAEVQSKLEEDPIKWCQAIVYPNNAACYANGGNNCTIEPTGCQK
jgi:hypothetical protein